MLDGIYSEPFHFHEGRRLPSKLCTREPLSPGSIISNWSYDGDAGSSGI